MLRSFVFALGVALSTISPAAAQTEGGGGFTPEAFDVWISARTGEGSPVYWYSVGTVRQYPSGKLVARMEGYDAARMVKAEEKGKVHQLSRKTYIYRDPVTNERLREVNGQKLEPIKYPYQFMTYWLDGDRMMSIVEQGVGSRIQKFGPSSGIYAQKLADTYAYTAPVFLDFETPRGRYEAFENYDFFIQPKGSTKEPHQLSWVRYGDIPPALGGGKGIMHMVSWRVEKFDDLPATVKEYVKSEAPLWLEPPKSVEEIRQIQQLARESDVNGYDAAVQ